MKHMEWQEFKTNITLLYKEQWSNLVRTEAEALFGMLTALVKIIEPHCEHSIEDLQGYIGDLAVHIVAYGAIHDEGVKEPYITMVSKYTPVKVTGDLVRSVGWALKGSTDYYDFNEDIMQSFLCGLADLAESLGLSLTTCLRAEWGVRSDARK